MSGRRRRKSGNHGHRLQTTAAPSGEIAARKRKARKPKPVTVRHPDGRVEVRSAASFEKGLQPRRRKRKPAGLAWTPTHGDNAPAPGQLAVIQSLIRQVRPARLPKQPRTRREADTLIDRLLEAFAST